MVPAAVSQVVQVDSVRSFIILALGDVSVEFVESGVVWSVLRSLVTALCRAATLDVYSHQKETLSNASRQEASLDWQDEESDENC
jgi:hypothetical protein